MVPIGIEKNDEKKKKYPPKFICFFCFFLLIGFVELCLDLITSCFFTVFNHDQSDHLLKEEETCLFQIKKAKADIYKV